MQATTPTDPKGAPQDQEGEATDHDLKTPNPQHPS